MPRREGDKVVNFWASADEHELLTGLARKERVSVVALLRLAVNSLAEESGDEAVFIEPRRKYERRA